MVKTIYWIQHKKNNRSRKKRDKDGKAFLQINEQRYIRKKNGKLESYSNA